MTWVCSCGERADHMLFQRRTADDQILKFWSNGDVSTSLGFGFRGIGSARNDVSEDRNRRANEWLADLVGFYDLRDVPRLISNARKLAGQSGWTSEAARKRLGVLMDERRKA